MYRNKLKRNSDNIRVIPMNSKKKLTGKTATL